MKSCLNIMERLLVWNIKKKIYNHIKMPPKESDKPKSRKANPWLEHVKSYAKKHNVSYRDALKDPKVKSSYNPKSK